MQPSCAASYRVFDTRETVKRQIVVHYIGHRSEAYKSAFSDRKKSMKKTNGLEQEGQSAGDGLQCRRAVP